MQSSMEITYIFLIICAQNLNVVKQLMNFFFAIKLSSDFHKVQISTNYKKIILKICCHFRSSC